MLQGIIHFSLQVTSRIAMLLVKILVLPCFCVICGGVELFKNQVTDCIKGRYLEDSVTFHMYTSDDILTGKELFINNITTLEYSGFDRELPTIFIIHGWSHWRNTPWLIEMRMALIENYRRNIIVVDWGELSHALYIEVRLHVNTVARQLAKFCIFLGLHKQIPLSSVHFIGHSLGAQISGVAGRLLQEEVYQKIGRITGLDPAAPLFEYPDLVEREQRLDPDDAEFVDVIHTNGNHLGVIHPVGHVDYYPNGGEIQPDCEYWVCSHMRSCELFITSIRNPGFFKTYMSETWDDYISQGNDGAPYYPMGMAATPSIPTGKYFLQVFKEDISPYLQTETTIFDSIYSI